MATKKKSPAAQKKPPLNKRINETYFDSAGRKERAAQIWELRRKGEKLKAKELLNPTLKTPAVKAFAKKFPETPGGISDMTKTIASFYTPEKNRDALQKVYDKTTAHDVVTTKKIGAEFHPKLGAEWGCKAACDTLVAALKSKGGDIRDVTYVRETNRGFGHSYVKFKMGDHEYLADPFPGSEAHLMPLRPNTKRELGGDPMVYSYEEGKDSKELGLTYKKLRGQRKQALK